MFVLSECKDIKRKLYYQEFCRFFIKFFLDFLLTC
nr:MAG TPA: hypothetical protein [Caudoviricetes sp.]